MSDTFVVVGGDAAGLSAASKLRREDPDVDVIVFERGEWVSYAACGMPYYVKGEVPELEDLVALTPAEVRDRGIDLRTGHEVVDVDSAGRTVTVSNGEGRFEASYDSLLLATGARAIEPPFEGMDLDGVFTIHDMDEAEAIRRFVDESAPETAAVVGGGYVGVEMAEALAAHDLTVHLFEMLPHVLQPFGDVVAEAVEAELREQGVHLHLDTAVSGFAGDERVDGVHLDDDVVPADVAVVGVGVEPNVALAERAGVELGPTGAVATDEYGRTNVDGVYAAGDCAEARHVVTEEPDYVPLALTANRAGRAIGRTVAGSPTPVGGTAGTAIVKAFDLGAARTGVVDVERAGEAGFEPVSTTVSAPTRAHYYPGATELTVTLLADGESGALLGGSVVGAEGAKRIDTLATALRAGMTVTELRNADLAYAPPFSPVWDPILTAAKVLEGELDREGPS
jgi:NADPH-dependent 2,4-dienoyl-CoA reductase/sulfur reductase-like enzyme